MVPGTGRLPHRGVPEPNHIALMRLDVIGDIGKRVDCKASSYYRGGIELMRIRKRRGIIAGFQLCRRFCEGGMRGEVMIK